MSKYQNTGKKDMINIVVFFFLENSFGVFHNGYFSSLLRDLRGNHFWLFTVRLL